MSTIPVTDRSQPGGGVVSPGRSRELVRVGANTQVDYLGFTTFIAGTKDKPATLISL